MKFVLASLAIIAIPLAAAAQTTPATDLSAGIRATGKGVATAPVSTVLVRVTARGVIGAEVDGKQLLAAMKAAGVEDPVIDQGRSAVGMTAVSIRGRVPNVTRAKLDAVSEAATEYAKSHHPVAITDVRFFGPAADCPAIEQRARDAALADARRREAAVAASTNVRLGEQLAVREDGGCPQVGPSGGANSVDISTLSMRVLVDETVTYAIVK